MPKSPYLCLWALALALGCNQADFSGKDPKKGPAPEKRAKELNASDANPNDPGDSVDCTGASEQECHDQKREENAKDSFRVIDCTTSPATECEKKVDDEIAKDGDEGSKIIVRNCKEDGAKTCEAIKGKPNVEMLTDSSSGDKVSIKEEKGLDVGDGGKTGTGKDVTLGDSDKITKGTFVCIGGIGGNISYVVKTNALASACLAFGNSHPCDNDPKCGNFRLSVYPCECDDPKGIRFTKDTNTCFRHNPLRPGATPYPGCVKR